MESYQNQILNTIGEQKYIPGALLFFEMMPLATRTTCAPWGEGFFDSSVRPEEARFLRRR